MSNPTTRLEAAIAAGAAPRGVKPHELRGALARWRDWCADEGRNPGHLSVEAGVAHLDALREREATLRTAHARFAQFQMAAGLAWGPETSAHLARTLRDVRVSAKPKQQNRWDRAATAVAGLPDAWRAPFEAFLARCREPAGRRTTGIVWSAARIEATARALTRFHAHAAAKGVEPIPTAALTDEWARSLHPREAAVSVASYVERVVRGHEVVLTPGALYDAAAAVADRWSARAEDEPGRKAKGGRIVPASRLDELGFELMARAEAAPLRRISEANVYRSGLLLCVLATLPERVRALAALEFDVTLFLEDDGFIRLAIPGEHLKMSEPLKRRRTAHLRIRRPSLHRALARWRSAWRPLYDDGAWLWPSQTNQREGLGETTLSRIIGDVTERELGRRVSAHLVRDCVATEVVERDPDAGPARASGVLRHRDPRITTVYTAHADDTAASAAWLAAVEDCAGRERNDLTI